jgi:F0F1-type ATP synthase assembly protein I
MAIGILGIIFFFITMIVFIESHYKTRHKERMAMIQMGKMPSEKDNSRRGLKFGILLLSLGVGIGVGNVLDMIFNSQPVFIFSCIFITSGAGMIAYQILAEKNKDLFKKWDDADDIDEIV